MNGASTTLITAVRDLKTAIQNAQQLTPKILISKAEVELKATLSAGPDASFSFGPVEVGGTYTQSEIQTLTLALTPVAPVAELMSPASDALTMGIVAVNIAAETAAAAAPVFGLDEATVELQFETEADGKVKIVVGAGSKSSTTHTLKLTLRKR